MGLLNSLASKGFLHIQEVVGNAGLPGKDPLTRLSLGYGSPAPPQSPPPP